MKMGSCETNRGRKHIMTIVLVMIMLVVSTAGCQNRTNATDYAQETNWAYYEVARTGTKADVFFVCPTVFFGDENTFNMSLSDEATKANFLGATNMEKGIYDGETRFFAPYYRQIGLNVYEMNVEDRENYMDIAYADVKNAFMHYLKNENNGNPIILAGFSQGADMCIRLLKDCFKDKATNDLLVACYAIGWRITEEELNKNPHLRFATGEKDTGVIISFNSEAEHITESLMIPSGTKTLAINPLNWKTDSTVATKSENKGACFTDYSGGIIAENENLTGAYIDQVRGALKVTDVNVEEYPSGLAIFEEGIYHIYDYQFFYRNLQENVCVRINAYLNDKN